LPGTIDWREWTASAFGTAETENKPILLSLVTDWSEECAAMEATTYAHPEVVKIVDTRFVAIRVDADRRPDVNERYNLGGWPTTAALTPDGHVLNGGTFFGPAEIVVMLAQAADGWRDRAEELRAKLVGLSPSGAASPKRRGLGAGSQPDKNAIPWFRAMLLDQVDAVHGGFGTSPKYPHPRALAVALTLAADRSDRALNDVIEIALDRIGALWDPHHGGFYRYAEHADWTAAGTEKTAEDNAALLHMYLDAAVRGHSDESQRRAGDLIRWITTSLADRTHGGFYNSQAAVSRRLDRSLYVDRNAEMIAAFLRAASVFGDPSLRDFALKSFEEVIVPGYTPGAGVSHSTTSKGSQAPGDEIRGLLGDQIRTASALIWAHLATEQLPYSMLALELVQYAVHAMWDEDAGCFGDRAFQGVSERAFEARIPAARVEPDLGLLRDRVRPFALNCDAACVLDRLATMTGDQAHRQRALTILGSLAGEYRQYGLFAAPYVQALCEVIDGIPPPGLNLSRVEWNLEDD